MNVFINKDKVLIVNMELANAIGLNRAIVLNQINYWIEKSNHVFEGKKWIYNSFESWHDQFQFWSLNTVKRIFKSLEKDGLIKTIRGKGTFVKCHSAIQNGAPHDDDQSGVSPYNWHVSIQDYLPRASFWSALAAKTRSLLAGSTK